MARTLALGLVALLLAAAPAVAAPPANDNFANGTELDNDSHELTVNNTEATGEDGEPNHEDVTLSEVCETTSPLDPTCNPSVWYTWTPDSSGTALADFDCSEDGFPLVTTAVYTGTAVNDLIELAEPEFICLYSFPVTGGQTYHVAFSGVDGEQSPNDFEANLDVVPTPSNDSFPGTELAGADVSFGGNTTGATGETGEPAHAGSAIEGGCVDGNNPHAGCIRSIWFSWTAPATGAATIDLCGSDYDTALAVYTGSAFDGDGLSLVGENDDTPGCGIEHPDSGIGTLGSKLTFQATQGTTYRIAVGGYQLDEAFFIPFGEVVGKLSLAVPVITPPAIVPPADTAFAGVALNGSTTLNLKGSSVTLTLLSPENATAAVRLDTASRVVVPAARRRARKLKIGSKNVTLTAGQRTAVTIRVSRNALKVLRAKGRLKAVLKLTGRDAAGNQRITTRRVTLKARKQKRRTRRSIAAR